jgi:hypothetical protein
LERDGFSSRLFFRSSGSVTRGQGLGSNRQGILSSEYNFLFMSSSPALRKANADFALEIDFVPGSPDPARVFRSMTQLIDTFQRFDRELVQTIDVHIEPVMVLEDIEAGSVKSWLRAVLNATDDTGLQELNWKRIVGGYLVRAKYLIIDC